MRPVVRANQLGPGGAGSQYFFARGVGFFPADDGVGERFFKNNPQLPLRFRIVQRVLPQVFSLERIACILRKGTIGIMPRQRLPLGLEHEILLDFRPRNPANAMKKVEVGDHVQ